MKKQPFIHEDFLLHTDAARELYHRYAASEPIYDYHCHLPQRAILTNHRFADISEIWLGGDHYKWRAMRTNGVNEDFVTGKAPSKEKFLAWCRTVPHTLRNPLYHWSHLELKRYFGIEDLIDESSAESIWKRTNAALEQLTVHRILENNRVAVICTTDDPADPLADHEAIAKLGIATKVYPTFRPDKAMIVQSPAAFNAWIEKLEGASRISVRSFDSFLQALEQRHADFHAVGGRLSDHGLEHSWSVPCTAAEAKAIFDRARQGQGANPGETAQFCSFLMLELGRWDAKRSWTKQLHLGALRNNNQRLLNKLGPDTGFDSIGDFPQAQTLSRYLNELDSTDQLPKTVIYNLNPADNYVFGTMIGNFQDGSIPGKLQFGSGWWFLDQKEAMEWQLNSLSNLGLLSRFVGMLTDSRSFLSYTRHEYFRRVLCNLLGQEMERGEIPNDAALVGGMVRNICFANARSYFGLGLDPMYS